MRAILRTVVLLLLFVPAFPQADGAAAVDDSLYSIALFASLKEMNAEWGHIDDSHGGNIRTDYHHARVEKDPRITDALPSQSGDFQVEYLDDRALIERYRTLGKSFSLLEINPIQNKGADLEINITVGYFSYKKRHMLFAVSDWSTVTFHYDCEKQGFVITDVKLGGI